MFRVLFLILLFSQSLFAAVRVEKVVAGLDGYVRGDRWLPVVFHLRSVGAEFRGTIEVVRGETIFRKSVDLSSGAARRTEILIYQSSMFENLKYRILDETGKILGEQRIETRMLNYQDNMLVVISDTDYNHQFLNGVQNPWGGKTFVSYLKSSEAYVDPLAYSSADSVALGNFSFNEMASAARQAILLYAATGGALICSPATNLSILKESPLASILPSISPELSELSHGEFLVSRWTAANSTTEFPSFELPIQAVNARDADHVLVTHTPELSIVSSSPFYKGGILYFAFDYTRMPEEVRTIFAGYWNDLVHPSSAGAPAFARPFRQRLEENPRAQRFLYDVPGLKLPDVKWFALFFFVYLMAIGPLQYLILTRMKKNALLWTTFPLIIFVFTASAVGYSKFRRTGSGSIRHVQVLESFPLLKAQVRYQGFGTAMSTSGNFSFQALPETSYMTKSARQTFTPMPEPYIFSETLPHSIVGEQIKTWAFRTYDAISSEPANSPLQVSAKIEGTRLVGQAMNSGNHPVENAFFLYDNRNAAIIGTIEPGATRNFSLELLNKSAPPFAENHLRGLLHLYGLTLTGPHFLFGEIHKARGEIIINGKSYKTDCLQYLAVYTNLHQAGPMNPWAPDYSNPYR